MKDPARIREAIERICVDLTRSENASVWAALHAEQPARMRIELFDMVWWSYFRQLEPVRPAQAAAAATTPAR